MHNLKALLFLALAATALAAPLPNSVPPGNPGTNSGLDDVERGPSLNGPGGIDRWPPIVDPAAGRPPKPEDSKPTIDTKKPWNWKNISRFHPLDKIVHAIVEAKVRQKNAHDENEAHGAISHHPSNADKSLPEKPRPAAHEPERIRAHCRKGCPCGLVESEFCECKVCRGSGREWGGPEVEV